MRGFISKGDHQLMHRVNNWEAPRWVRFYVLGATRGGDGWLWYAMGLAILLFGGENRFAALGAAGVSVAPTLGCAGHGRPLLDARFSSAVGSVQPRPFRRAQPDRGRDRARSHGLGRARARNRAIW